MRRCSRPNNQWNVWLKEPNTNARGEPDFSPLKVRASSTTMNLKSKRRNVSTAIKPSVVQTLVKLWEDSYTTYQIAIRSNDSGWTHLNGEWTLNTEEINGGGSASGTWTSWTLEGTWYLKLRIFRFGLKSDMWSNFYEVWHLVQIKHAKYEQINEYIYEFMNIWIMKILWMLIMNSTCNWRS